MSIHASLRRETVEGAAALDAEGIARRFGARVVLRDVDLRVSWGESVALLGSNGAGKSTFLRIAAGALRPTGGSLQVGGHGIRRSADAVRATTALLAGDSFLYHDLTARENLRFAVRMSGGDASDQKLDAALDAVGLAYVAGARIRHFSSGMRKRLALARVTAIAPPLLLLDEPYASLDEEAMGLVDDVVARWTRAGRSVLMATHLRGRAYDVCHRVVRLEAGVVQPDAPRVPAPRLLEVAP